MARAMYLDLTGQKVPQAPLRDGRKWVIEDRDLAAAFREWRRGTLSAREWIVSLAGIEEAAFFAPDDPWPLLQRCVRHICAFARGAATRGGRKREEAPAPPAMQPSPPRAESAPAVSAHPANSA